MSNLHLKMLLKMFCYDIDITAVRVSVCACVRPSVRVCMRACMFARAYIHLLHCSFIFGVINKEPPVDTLSKNRELRRQHLRGVKFFFFFSHPRLTLCYAHIISSHAATLSVS